MHTCKHCERQFESIRSLNAHQISHKNGERYSVVRQNKSTKQQKTTQCLCCAKVIPLVGNQPRKFCDNLCQQNFSINEKIKSGAYTRSTAMSWFKKNTEYKCSCCGIDSWMGKHIVLQIDHIDGNNDNNDISNLRYLCANCHTQTDTWGVKNASENGRARMCTNKKI